MKNPYKGALIQRKGTNRSQKKQQLLRQQKINKKKTDKILALKKKD